MLHIYSEPFRAEKSCPDPDIGKRLMFLRLNNSNQTQTQNIVEWKACIVYTEYIEILIHMVSMREITNCKYVFRKYFLLAFRLILSCFSN